MGFTPRSKVYRLDFEGDPELDGLVVRARSAPIGFVTDLAGFASRFDGAGAELTDDQVTAITTMIASFAEVLISWNLELEEGVPTPATAAGLRQLETAHFLRLITAWQQAVINVPAPLPGPSSGGEQSLEASLPMDPSLESPPS